jgi:hypothetical protein
MEVTVAELSARWSGRAARVARMQRHEGGQAVRASGPTKRSMLEIEQPVR